MNTETGKNTQITGTTQIADLHIHSKYSRATSRDCDTPHLDLWARKKGIHILGTGDFTHPAWRKELEEHLVPAEEGLYVLKDELRLPNETAGPGVSPRFLVTGEISSIYKKNGKVRKVHNLLLLPGLPAAELLSQKLEAIGNIHSDGRPILGLDCRDLLEITLETCPDAMLIPAHIWTPHFSLFGAFSGFESIEECFEDLTPHVYALETGLSSDPPMNWMVSGLDPFLLVSNSDAHSPAKLGREANLLSIDLSYPNLSHAIRTGDGFLGTLEFYPEEGKYHYDGHRACKLCLSPSETMELGGICPVCGKKITIGVQHRVEDLADRSAAAYGAKSRPFESLVPLPEVIAASFGSSPASVRTSRLYEALLKALGPEFYILREAPLDEIQREGGPLLAEGIRRLRRGQVSRKPGFDGEYGEISLLSPEERETLMGQISFFGESPLPLPFQTSGRGSKARKTVAGSSRRESSSAPPLGEGGAESKADTASHSQTLNAGQTRAVTETAGAVAVIAGPGTGKTKTLISRIQFLIEERGVKASHITAVTFTNLAAAQLRERLANLPGGKRRRAGVNAGTFHGICKKLVEEETGYRLVLVSAGEAQDMAREIIRELQLSLSPREFLLRISRIKNGISTDEAGLSQEALSLYNQRLESAGVLDFDDLLLAALEIDRSSLTAFDHLLVDEFQDISQLEYRLIRRWRQHGKTLFVIGDPDQSIYGFRGAGRGFFDQLAEDEPGLSVIRLEENYRSTPQILDGALPVISRNPGGPRMLKPHRKSGASIRLITSESDYEEAIFIAKEIGRMAGGVDMLDAQKAQWDGEPMEALRSFSDMAILCRTRRQLELIEKCLRHDSIPCIVCGRDDFLLEEEIRGVLGFFSCILNPRDVPALFAALKIHWSCPQDMAVQVAAMAESWESWDTAALRSRWQSPCHLDGFLEAMEVFLPRIRKEKPRKLLDLFQKEKKPTKSMEKLMHMAVFFDDMASFLESLLLGREADLRRAEGRTYASGAVSLMTLHGSKGLEFPVVFLPGMKKGVLPLESASGKTDLEEERRLFYVGMTRARDQLLLLASSEASEFISDLPQGSLITAKAPALKPQGEAVQLSLF